MMIIFLTSSFKKNKNISYPLNHHLENQHHDFSHFKKPSSIDDYYSRITSFSNFARYIDTRLQNRRRPFPTEESH